MHTLEAEPGTRAADPEADAVEALTAFLLESGDVSNFEVHNFDELWLARQALQTIHDLSIPEKLHKSRHKRDSYEVGLKDAEAYIPIYESVNQAILRFQQNGHVSEAADDYREKLEGRHVARPPSFKEHNSHTTSLFDTISKDAACKGVDTSLFFPSTGPEVEIAQKICRNCPVQVECLEYALELKIKHGVWGGASERERRRIPKRRRSSQQ